MILLRRCPGSIPADKAAPAAARFQQQHQQRSQGKQRMMPTICMMVCCFMASTWLHLAKAENDNLSMSSVANSETIKIGNTKTNNYNIQGSNFLPTQLTQVVLNVPKIGKKLRRTRQPTVEEMTIKGKILETYERAREETSSVYSVYLEHLGRIIRALNPKYIATERVRRVAFADPRDPNSLIPLPEFNPLQVEMALAEGSPLDKLNLLIAKFNELVSWDENIVEEFAAQPDESLEPCQAAFKRVILCLSNHPLCAAADNQRQPDQAAAQEEPVVAASRVTASAGQTDPEEAYPSSTNEVYMAPPPPLLAQPMAHYYQPQPSYEGTYQQEPPGFAQQPPVIQATPHHQMAPNQRPRLQIPDDVKQRFYQRQLQAGPDHQIGRQGGSPRVANHRRGGRRY